MEPEQIDILLVEDRAEDAELTRIALADHSSNGQVHWIRDGRKAIDFLFRKENQELITGLKLILLDVNLPKMNGLEVLQKIKTSHLKHIPVVMISTSYEKRDVDAAYANHANSYVTKPTNFAEFASLVTDLGNYWISINRTVD